MNLHRGLPLPFLILSAVAVLVLVITRHTPMGRYLYAIGGNEEAAALSGVPRHRPGAGGVDGRVDLAQAMSPPARTQAPSRRLLRRCLASCTDCAYNHDVRWQWDPGKAAENVRKHGVDFADAVLAFEDERAVTVEDNEHDERRFVSLGMDPQGRLLVVVYTWRAGTIRIISARKANRRERREYGRQVTP